jgi:hypothetical protein
VVNGVVDNTWSGFLTRTVVDFAASEMPLACPQNEVVDAFEVNFAFPNGICGFQNNGNKRVRHVEYEIQYRVYGSGSGWTSKQGFTRLKTLMASVLQSVLICPLRAGGGSMPPPRAGEQQRERQHVLAGARRFPVRPPTQGYQQ